MDNYVITIARSYGSGGRTMGKMLAEELGIEYYDKELLKLGSEESGINEILFGESDEKVLGKFKFEKGVYKGEIIEPGKSKFTSPENLFNYQAEVIKKLADTKSCVIIGRCADYILKDYKNVIRLYFYAPMESCIARTKELFGLGEEELVKKIKTIDKERAFYYEYYTGQKWNDASNYDLCLNTESMSYETCLKIVKSYIETLKPDLNEKKTLNLGQNEDKKDEVKHETVKEEAEEVNLALLQFLDTRSYDEKLQIIRRLGMDMDDKLIDDMAASLDVTVPEGDIDTRINSLKNAIITMSKFDGANRLR